MNLLKMCGPKIQLCLFTLRPTALKQLNSPTTIGGPVVMHPTEVREVPGSISGSGMDLYV